jgi:hypothetical protein
MIKKSNNRHKDSFLFQIEIYGKIKKAFVRSYYSEIIEPIMIQEGYTDIELNSFLEKLSGFGGKRIKGLIFFEDDSWTIIDLYQNHCFEDYGLFMHYEKPNFEEALKFKYEMPLPYCNS